MGYNYDKWGQRFAERNDMSAYLVHLTRESDSIGHENAVLAKILSEKKLNGSSTSSGFICGPDTAVCFQDAPLYSICQSVYYEQKLREQDSSLKVRYSPMGLMFSKGVVYKSGGRPVIYEKTEIAKNILAEDEWWRIVNLNYDNPDSLIDWTHEREWRVKGDFHFQLEDTTLIVVDMDEAKKINKLYKEANGRDLFDLLGGIIVLDKILY
ncbi:hypothetical protein [Photobacterium leiognathi]|uniref:hypothetical protein n=1 Tax=Photobacterium leiognathi TaxID=553611 RepID=UPI002982528B|nr:hypothetical protein [Photobacterium leiognathi]